MDTQHRYFRLAHSSDALIAVYRKELAELTEAKKRLHEREGRHGLTIALMLVFSLTGLFVVTELAWPIAKAVGEAFVVLCVLVSVFGVNAGYQASNRLEERRRGLPCLEILDIFTPLEELPETQAEVKANCDRYGECQAYVDAVLALNRKLYQFDANYVVELSAVLKRGDQPQASTWPGANQRY